MFNARHELREEPTLGVVLRQAVRVEIPARFYQLLQLALPFALQFAFGGRWRWAAGGAAISAFGLWGLCVQRFDCDADSGWRLRALRICRVACGTLAAVVTLVLVLEAFLRLMGPGPTF
jgi:hypothetical protein